MKQEWYVVIAAAASAAGLLSGRTIAMFYTQTGWVSWVGVIAASALYGLICGCACETASEVLWGRQGRRLFAVGYGLLIAAVGSVMLNAAGRLTALALSVRHAYWMGILAALGIAFLLNMRGMRFFCGFAAVTIVTGMLFCLGLALDPRPVRFYQSFETVAELSGSIPAGLVLACLHAALCSMISIGMVARWGSAVRNPVRFAVKCGAVMLMMLACANAAMLRGGPRLLSLTSPDAALAARWGKLGYYFCIFSMAMKTVCTLCACVGAVTGWNAKYDKNPC